MFCGKDFNLSTAYVFIQSFAFHLMQMLNLFLMLSNNNITMVFVKISTVLFENALYIPICICLRKNLVLTVAR